MCCGGRKNSNRPGKERRGTDKSHKALTSSGVSGITEPCHGLVFSVQSDRVLTHWSSTPLLPSSPCLPGNHFSFSFSRSPLAKGDSFTPLPNRAHTVFILFGISYVFWCWGQTQAFPMLGKHSILLALVLDFCGPSMANFLENMAVLCRTS